MLSDHLQWSPAILCRCIWTVMIHLRWCVIMQSVVNPLLCFSEVGRWWHVVFVMVCLLLCFHSGYGLACVMQACSFEPSFSLLLNTLKCDFEVVYSEAETHCSLLCFSYFAPGIFTDAHSPSKVFFALARSCVRSSADVTIFLVQ
jgi:hypothetical protein